MTTRSASYVDAIDHLPEGATVVFPEVSWEEYQTLLADLESRPGLRASYDNGRLQVVSPSAEHEAYKDLALRLAQTVAEELGVPLETRGSTTWKRRALAKGVEPDASFYVSNAHRVIGRRTIDLETDPPPDIVVEIDVTNESLSKFPIYAALGVPEIWRYDGSRFDMYELQQSEYVPCSTSRSFPELTAPIVFECLELSKTAGQTKAIEAFRQRLRRPRA